MQCGLSTSKAAIVHHVWFGLFSILSLLVFRKDLDALMRLALGDERYSHVLLIPILSAALVYLQRSKTFTGSQFSLSTGVPLLIAAAALYYVVQPRKALLTSEECLSSVVLAIILVWVSGFVICYGVRSFRIVLFPWLFLLLMIPIPSTALDTIVLALQKGSAVLTYALFKLLGVPVLWQRFRFVLPGVEIEIAQECSGIRSSQALFITSILAGHLLLRSNWKRTFFSLITIPVVIFKNALRIVTISYLGVYVDSDFLHGKLHRYGGLPFSLLSLSILLPLLLALQRNESRPKTSTNKSVAEDQRHRDPNSSNLNSVMN